MSKKYKKHHRSDYEAEEFGESKPLKLVLKVGGIAHEASPSSVQGSEGYSEKRLKHKKRKKHKDKKEKRRKEYDSEGEDVNPALLDEDSKFSEVDYEAGRHEDDANDDASYMEPPSIKRARVTSKSEHQQARSLRDRKQDGDRKGALFFLLDYMQKTLQKKDGSGIFAFPVTDLIAPRYSEIVKYPMDFSTMRKKIDSFQYQTVAEYKLDFKTMLENCMLYNHPDTIYYKEAQRLLGIGLKQLSKDRIRSLKRSLPSVAELSDSELGLSDDEDQVPYVEYISQRKRHDKFEAIADHMTADDVLAQVQAAAKHARDALNRKQPGSKLGFLNRHKDGPTYLNILNPDNDGIISEKERVVTLGNVAGRLTSGSHALAAYREDKRNKATPVSYLTYGSFSSYAPIYDSTTATVSKEVSDMLLSAYANDSGMQYAKSIRHFVEDCGEVSVRMVDDLLNILTQGQHSKVLQAEAEEAAKRKAENPQEETLIEALIRAEDVRKQLDNEESEDTPTAVEQGQDLVQQELTKTSELLLALQAEQLERLTRRPTPVQPLPAPPSDTENKLAQEVTKSLAELTRAVKPENVVSEEGVRKAMGIQVVPEYDLISPPSPKRDEVGADDNQSDSGESDDSQDGADEETSTKAPSAVDQSRQSLQAVLAAEDSNEPMSIQDTISDSNMAPQSQESAGPMEVDETAAAVAGIL